MDPDIARLPIGRAINRGGRRIKILLAILVIGLPLAVLIVAFVSTLF